MEQLVRRITPVLLVLQFLYQLKHGLSIWNWVAYSQRSSLMGSVICKDPLRNKCLSLKIFADISTINVVTSIYKLDDLIFTMNSSLLVG